MNRDDRALGLGFACAKPGDGVFGLCGGTVWIATPEPTDDDGWRQVSVPGTCDRCGTAYTFTAQMRGPRVAPAPRP